MNTNTIDKTNKELIEKKNKFPITMEDGSPFGVSEQITIKEGKPESDNKFVPGENPEKRLVVTPDIAKDFIAEQIGHLIDSKKKLPNNPYILNNIGTAYLNNGDIENALVNFKEALNIKGDFLSAKKNLAKIYTMKGCLDDALKIYFREMDRHPSDTQIQMGIVHVYIRQGKLEQAQDILTQIVSIDKENAGAYHNLGILALSRNKIDEAISYFRKAISIDGNLMLSYNALGVCYYLRNNFKQAIKYFTIALGTDKNNANTLKNLATTYSANGEYEKSIDILEKYLSQYPMDLNARILFANTCFKVKKYDKCLWNLQYVNDNWDKQPDVIDKALLYNNIGVAYVYLKNIAYAYSALNKSISMVDEKHMAIPYMNMVNLYITQKHIDSAEKLVKIYIEKNPTDYLPVMVLSDFFYNTNDFSKSMELTNIVLEKKKDDPIALSSLSNIYNEVNVDRSKALEYAQKAYELNSSNNLLLNNLAYSYLLLGRLSEAKVLLSKVKVCNYHFALFATKGLLRILEGNLEEGIKLYDEAEKTAPSLELKQQVKQKKFLEIGKYYVSRNEYDKAKQELIKIKSIKSEFRVYINQAENILVELNNSIK
jgi:tetratricopeptide (TPR) repeat protein